MSRPHRPVFSALLFLALIISLVSKPAAAEESKVNLVSELERKYRTPEAEAAEQVERVFSLIREALKSGKSIEVRNFGKFSVRKRLNRQKKKLAFQGPLPPAVSKRIPFFLPTESLKEDLNSSGT